MLVASAESAAELEEETTTTYAPGVAAPLPHSAFAGFIEGYYHAGGPTQADIVPPRLTVVRTEDLGDHERLYVTYYVEDGEQAPAWILKPKTAPRNGRAGYPLIVAPHPTYYLGKDGVIGKYATEAADEDERIRRARRSYGLDLVRRGYVVFAPDRAGYGERVPDRVADSPSYEERTDAYFNDIFKPKWPGWTMTRGKATWDLERGLDAVLTSPDLPFIDRGRVGAAGFSLGAWDSGMLAAYEGYFQKRLQVVVVAGGPGFDFDAQLFNDPVYLQSYLDTPAKRTFTKNTNLLVMLTAPTPLLSTQGFNDPGYTDGMPSIGWYEATKTISEFYLAKYLETHTALNYWRAPFAMYAHNNSHSFDHDARALAYEFIDSYLYGDYQVIPTYVTDSFSATPGTTIGSHTGERGADWTQHPAFQNSTSLITSTRRVRGASTVVSAYYASWAPTSPDYAVEADVYVQSVSGLGAVTARTNTTTDTAYICRYYQFTGEWGLYKAVNGYLTRLDGTPATLTPGRTYRLKIIVNGSTQKCLVDGVTVATAEDMTITLAGRPGFRQTGGAGENVGFHLDYVKATAP